MSLDKCGYICSKINQGMNDDVKFLSKFAHERSFLTSCPHDATTARPISSTWRDGASSPKTTKAVKKPFPRNSEGSIKGLVNPHVRDKTYLGTLRNNHTSTSILFVSQDVVPLGPLIAADLGAYRTKLSYSHYFELIPCTVPDYTVMT